jgi:hypothetical protein
LSPDVFADADARRRNNCWGFLSYRYKTKASILSLAPWNGKNMCGISRVLKEIVIQELKQPHLKMQPFFQITGV